MTTPTSKNDELLRDAKYFYTRDLAARELVRDLADALKAAERELETAMVGLEVCGEKMDSYIESRKRDREEIDRLEEQARAHKDAFRKVVDIIDAHHGADTHKGCSVCCVRGIAQGRVEEWGVKL